MKGGAGTRGDFAGDGKSGWSASIQTILTGRAGAVSNKPQHDILRDAIRDAVRAEVQDTLLSMGSDMRILTNMVLVLAAAVVALAVFLVFFTVNQLRQQSQTKQPSAQSRQRLQKVQPGLARVSSTESLERTGSAQSRGSACWNDSKRSALWNLAFLRGLARRVQKNMQAEPFGWKNASLLARART